MKRLIIDTLKTIYAIGIKMLSYTYYRKPLKNKVTYLLSFPNNNHGLIEALGDKHETVVCYTKEMTHEANQLAKLNITTYNIDTFFGMIFTIKSISTSKLVLADNYYPLLGDIKKKRNQKIVQLWHATGAIKQFGLEDKAVIARSKKDRARFKRVYECFDYFVVGSKSMADVFKRSYGATEAQMLYLGFPRTDYLVNLEKVNHPHAKILYLPTYRDVDATQMVRDLLELRKKLPLTNEVLVKMHPHMTFSDQSIELLKKEQISLFDQDVSADELLIQADALITDYSSVAFDYALINPVGKLIFYWFDEEAYREKTGIQASFSQELPFEICHTVEEVINQLEQKRQDLSEFNQVWNTYNDGFATERLLNWIDNELGGDE